MTNAASQVPSYAWLRMKERAHRGTARVIFKEIAGVPGTVDTNRLSKCMISIRLNTVAVSVVLSSEACIFRQSQPN
jgi:hypothetical protein